ncbi:Heat shock protein Hsp90 [Isosphaera pallida ATCC 43644]|uniref:Chaperone protein HtpG n=1 Tax=Isosphaera pallida (strain ATCC 43644 / DSM 9630 / IS1B) TaxID=575540 RepID=E8R150_ISOPI|nr:molecular chaperone HtpG [Isosphaera pallida]ADV63401.1 Heat shock protein Hsp90 [Isosphaera pallida ATCC 43644]
MTTQTPPVSERHAFQAEIKQLLNLLAHSIYQGKEIALRELISNASDALNKMRLTALVEGSPLDPDELGITLTIDKEAGTLTIADNGVGMTHEELRSNLGTIAHSGSREFVRNLTRIPEEAKAINLIGQFGVGFYSAFMVADRVVVLSRSHRSEETWKWESDGTGEFTISPADESRPRGTSVILHLKPETKEFLEPWRVKSVVKRFSGFIPQPIRLDGEVLNDQKAIWLEPRNQVTEEEHTRFFRHLSHREGETPLFHLHVAVDSPIQFRAVLYCPPTNFESIGFGKLEHGVQLCARRVLVQSNCQEILPGYLRFLHGLVDSEDLPLNISRETLQDNAVLRKIQNTLVKHVLDRLSKLAEEAPQTYETFYEQFGIILKEGIHTDFLNRDRIAKLLRFISTANEGEEADRKRTSLEQYVGRMREGQTQIYFLGGPDLNSIRKNPHLAYFKSRQLEVLLLPDPIDEFVITSLDRFDGKPLVSIDSARVELPPQTESTSADAQGKEATTDQPAVDPARLDRVLSLFKAALEGKVSEVRTSQRLLESPVGLIHAEGSLTTSMRKLLQMANRNLPESASNRILEVNPNAAIIRRFADLSVNPDHDDFIKQCARQLYANALLLEGVLDDPESMVGRITDLMEKAAQSRSPILTS